MHFSSVLQLGGLVPSPHTQIAQPNFRNCVSWIVVVPWLAKDALHYTALGCVALRVPLRYLQRIDPASMPGTHCCNQPLLAVVQEVIGPSTAREKGHAPRASPLSRSPSLSPYGLKVVAQMLQCNGTPARAGNR